MHREEQIPFLTEVWNLLRAPVRDQQMLSELLRRFGVPACTEELRDRCAKCRTPVERLIPLRRESSRTSAHDHSTTDQWICWCPTLSTLVLKRSTLFASRTHGHHFRETWHTSFRLLNDGDLWDLIIADPESVEEAVVRLSAERRDGSCEWRDRGPGSDGGAMIDH